MSATTQVSDLLDILNNTDDKVLKVDVTTKKGVAIRPLSFKQQKLLVTSGLSGVVGVMIFIKSLNDVILNNTKEDDLKIYDRIPLVLALRNNISDKPIKKDDVEISLDSVIGKFKKFDGVESILINGQDFNILLKVPTLKQENRYLAACIEELKRSNEDNIGKNVSLILSYEVPKFIDEISFGDKTIVVDELSISDRNKILDSLPANITNQITDFILQIRDYDEYLLTVDGVTVDVDYSLFE
jgi:hypothetical protein